MNYTHRDFVPVMSLKWAIHECEYQKMNLKKDSITSGCLQSYISILYVSLCLQSYFLGHQSLKIQLSFFYSFVLIEGLSII